MKRYDFILPLLSKPATALPIVFGFLVLMVLLWWRDLRSPEEPQSVLKVLAMRLRFRFKPGSKTENAPEDTFETLYRGWLIGLGLRWRGMHENKKRLLPVLHVEHGLELPRELEAIPRVWAWTLPFKDRPRCFEVGSAALDARFVWLCEQTDQPWARALLRTSDVQRALMALGSDRAAFVRIEKNRVELIIEHVLDEASLRLYMDALVAVVNALQLAVAPAREELRRGA